MLSRRQQSILVLVGLLLFASGVGGAVQVALSNPYPVTPGTTFATSTGAAVSFGFATSTNVSSGGLGTDPDEISLSTSRGAITVSGDGPAYARLTSLSGGWTNATDVDVSANSMTLSHPNGQTVTVGGDVEEFNLSEVQTTGGADGQTDFRYAGTSGTTTITIYGLSAGTPLRAVDLDTGENLDTATTTGQGTVTFELSNSAHRVDVRTQSDPPYVESSSPRGGEFVSNRSVTLSATVVDPDGGDVDADIEVYNQTTGTWTVVSSTTVASGTTITTDVQANPGTNIWRADLQSQEDLETRTTGNFTYRTPGMIRVYDGTTESPTLLNGTTVDYRIRATDTNFERTGTASTGSIDLEGVPETQLRISLNASGFEQRILTINDPATSRDAVMAPTGNNTFVQAFALNDLTGNYPASDTTLVVEQYFDGQWREIASESFGSQNSAEITLSDGTDYRLSIRNDQNDIRQLSVFPARIDRSDVLITLTVEQVEDKRGDFSELGYSWDARYNDPDGEQAYIRFTLDTEAKTSVDNLRLVIYERGDRSNEIYNNSFGLVNSLVVTQPLTADQANKTWIVEWSGTVDDEAVQGSRSVGSFKTPVGVPLSDWWAQLLGVGMLLVVGGLFGGRQSSLGAVVIALLGGMLWFIGFLPGAVAGGAVVAALVVAIAAKAKTTRF